MYFLRIFCKHGPYYTSRFNAIKLALLVYFEKATQRKIRETKINENSLEKFKYLITHLGQFRNRIRKLSQSENQLIY